MIALVAKGLLVSEVLFSEQGKTPVVDMEEGKLLLETFGVSAFSSGIKVRHTVSF